MEMFNYYTIDECIDRKSVIEKLDSLVSEGKISYDIDGEVLKIEDIDLEESDIKDLEELFDNNDVFPYLEREDEEGEDDYDNYYDDEGEEY